MESPGNGAIVRSQRLSHRTPRIDVAAEQGLRRVGEGGGVRLLDVTRTRAELDGCRAEMRIDPIPCASRCPGAQSGRLRAILRPCYAAIDDERERWPGPGFRSGGSRTFDAGDVMRWLELAGTDDVVRSVVET